MEDEALELTPAETQAIERLGQEFLAQFYESALARRPGALEVLSELANLYTQLGRIPEGLSLDRELAARLPLSSTAHYNLACSLALSGDAAAALKSLEHAFGLGYDDLEHLLADEDLRSLHGDERFERLVERLRDPGS